MRKLFAVVTVMAIAAFLASVAQAHTPDHRPTPSPTPSQCICPRVTAGPTPNAFIFGTVTDQDQNPAPGVSLYLESEKSLEGRPDPIASASADIQGKFLLQASDSGELPDGCYLVGVKEHSDYQTPSPRPEICISGTAVCGITLKIERSAKQKPSD